MKFSGGEGGAKGRVRSLRARGSAELGKVASGSTTQGLLLEDRKVGSQVIGIDRSRFPGRGGRASDGAKERVHRFRVRFG